jgi:hypothetical protein
MELQPNQMKTARMLTDVAESDLMSEVLVFVQAYLFVYKLEGKVSL